MKLSRRTFAGMAGTLLATLSLANSAVAQQQGGTLVMIVQPEPPSLASYLSTSGPIGMVTSKIYDGLLEYDTELSPQPGLAESWEVSPDGQTITFKLRQGVKFHDGEPLTAADVKFSILKAAKVTHPRGPNTFAPVTEVQTPDDHTVTLVLSEPAPYMLMAFSGYETPILPEHIFSTGICARIRTPTSPSAPDRSSSRSGRRASTSAWTATRTTGRRGSRTSIASLRASSPTRPPAPQHSRRARPTSRPWVQYPSTTRKSLPRSRA